MRRIDLNVDIGEGFPHDTELLRYATSANVCCGEHAGSWELTAATVAACEAAGVRVGMHPGYPDRESMGRAPMEPEDFARYRESLLDQCRRFYAEFDVEYLKPHGAFYNEAQVEASVAEIAIEMVAETGLPIMGIPGTLLEMVGQGLGAGFIREGFADRRYDAEGLLVPRGEPHAVLTDPEEIRTQVLRLARTVDSICLHGDGASAVEFAVLVRRTLTDAGYEIGP